MVACVKFRVCHANRRNPDGDPGETMAVEGEEGVVDVHLWSFNETDLKPSIQNKNILFYKTRRDQSSWDETNRNQRSIT